MPEVSPGPAYDDGRGRLVPVEFDEVGFVPVRAFVVTADVPSTRGGHRTGCRELLVLVRGEVVVRVGATRDDAVAHTLSVPGDRLHLEPDTHVDYDLCRAGTTLLVLADVPYSAVAEER